MLHVAVICQLQWISSSWARTLVQIWWLFLPCLLNLPVRSTSDKGRSLMRERERNRAKTQQRVKSRQSFFSRGRLIVSLILQVRLSLQRRAIEKVQDICWHIIYFLLSPSCMLYCQALWAHDMWIIYRFHRQRIRENYCCRRRRRRKHT